MSRSQNASKELTEVLNELWRLDTNRLKPGTDYIISLQANLGKPQGKLVFPGTLVENQGFDSFCEVYNVTSWLDMCSKYDIDVIEGQAGYVAQGSNYARDRAREPLFKHVNADKLKHIETYAHFINLLDNYEMSTGVGETVTSEELKENRLFIDAIVQTEVMKCAHKYLVKKGQSSSNIMDFKRQLYDIWFKLYHRERGGGEDSCGFEHVFVGETKNHKEIMGLHNWIQFYLQEKLGNVDYKGYKARDNKDTPDEDDHVLSLQFSWRELVKPVGSSFIGVSPEFEVALFTIIFLMSNEKMTSVVTKIDEYVLELVVYRQGRSIGTSFPKLLSSNHRDL